MKNKRIQSNILLLAASLIWGFAFVAQRRGMDFTGPLTFNGIRFLLGALTLLPFMLLFKPSISFSFLKNRMLLLHGIMAGLALFVASSFQQVGIIYTSAGKAGFITSLYILFVPAFGLLRRQSSGPKVWTGAIIATIGLYLLSVHENMQMDMGDLLVLISAVFWAMHMIVLSYIAPLHDFRVLAFIQFFVSGFISLVLAFIFESPDFNQLSNAALPILYAGIASAGIGFTLQVAGQRHARADHAALILSLEAVFAVLGGYLLLQEKMTVLDLTGCALMLAGVIISQYKKVGNQEFR
ncbi:MAG: DMT family transporter [Bacteroidales bacterium]|nr:DMT family transporter [Bacteroidales bacterium]